MYHYTDCGLQNVWLVNGYKRHKTPYGPGTSIDDIPGLHRAIGSWIVRKPRPVTGAELRFLRKELDLSQKGLAEYLGQTEQTVSLWERRGKIPKMADRFVRAIFRESVEGNAKIKELVERLAARESGRGGERAQFALRSRRWKTAA